jgi:osmotically-inducible protein OsmY
MKSDGEILRNIECELHWDPGLDEGGIEVAVHGGMVTLTGEVGTFDDRWNAEEIAACVSGVRGVANEIEVRVLRPHTPRNDATPRFGGQCKV